jgi:hypothetical protein
MPVILNLGYTDIDAHGLKIPSGGVKAFRKKSQEGPPISGFIAFLLTNVLKFV